MATGRGDQRGFAYLYALMLIALVGLGLGAAGTVWRTDAQRMRETELLFVGDQYRRAIRSYYELNPAQPRLPRSIGDLLEDNRRPDVVRHLRRAWRDPLTGGELELIHAPGTQDIIGVTSGAPGHPLRTAGFAAEDEAFAGATRYAGWRFVFTPPAEPADRAPGRPAPGGTPPAGPAPD